MKPTDSTPNPQSVCKHCQKQIAFRGNYWLQIETNGYLSDEFCKGNRNGRHEPTEPASLNAPAGTEGREPEKKCGCVHGDSDPYCPDPGCPNYIAAYHQHPAAPQPVAGDGPTRNSEVLASFVRYCQENPEHRFWQALRNWSGYPFITVSDFSGESRDTFYWKGKRHDGK